MNKPRGFNWCRSLQRQTYTRHRLSPSVNTSSLLFLSLGLISETSPKSCFFLVSAIKCVVSTGIVRSYP
ncbi:hypothetical protein L1887_09223 [Cichorium endivia]|nr:hypothetical protein L1887_09223 [Cichorium endivia]